MKRRSGFTLVEILIVVVILGILAAIVIPQFSDASEEAKLSSLVSDLQTIRSQIQLYKIQHKGKVPQDTSVTTTLPTFVQAMTMYTDDSGALTAAQVPGDKVYGPYLQKIPANPFSDSNEVSVGVGAPAGDDSSGWYYNSTTGAFYANDAPAHVEL
jgi:general secretion pathway protein G